MWLFAVPLVLAAAVSTVWVLTHDLSGAEASAGASSSAPGTPEASTMDNPVDPSPEGTPTPSASPTPSPAPQTGVTLRSDSSSRCLDVPGGTAVDGAGLQIYDCNGSTAQEWSASPAGELRVLGSMCLDDPSGGEPSTQVTIWTCHGGANQQWAPQPDGTVRNAATGLCLDVSGAATDNKTPVIMYDCHAGDNQRWSTS